MASNERNGSQKPFRALDASGGSLPQPLERQEPEIDLLELLSVVMANIRWVIAAILAGAVLAFLYTQYFITPMYRSTGSIYVVSSKDAVVSLSDFQVSNFLTSDYEKVVYTWEVLQTTTENLGLPYSQEELRKMITVINPQNTRILEITVQSSNPGEAARIANELMVVVSNFVGSVMETEKPNILSEAKVPIERYSPSKTRNTLLGGVLGGSLSLLAIFIVFMLDDKVKTPDDIQKYAGMPTLAIVPHFGDERRGNFRPETFPTITK